jgi:hypothetical protein
MPKRNSSGPSPNNRFTTSLFNEGDAVQAGRPGIVPRVAEGATPLSREQKEFNRLTERIHSLRDSIATEQQRMDRLFAEYSSTLLPRLTELAALMLEVARSLADLTTERQRLGKRQRGMITDTILNLCRNSFDIVPPDEERAKFYDFWMQRAKQELISLAYDDEMMEFGDEMMEIREEIEDGMRRYIAEQMWRDTGGRMSEQELADGEEGFERYTQRVHDFLSHDPTEGPRQGDSDDAGPARGGHPPRKKNRKQMEQEALQEQRKRQQAQTIREVYLSLAKVLHPDLCTNPAELTRNEELMKRVTEAYGRSDIASLLALQIEWVDGAAARLDALPAEALRVHIAALREQAAMLKRDLVEVRFQPRYAGLADMHLPRGDMGFAKLQDAVLEEQRRIDQYRHLLSLLRGPSRRNTVLAFVAEYLEELDDQMRF